MNSLLPLRALRLGAAFLPRPRPFLPSIQSAYLSASALSQNKSTTSTSISTTTTTTTTPPLPASPRRTTPRAAAPKKHERSFSRPLPPPPTKTEQQLGSELAYVVRRTVSQGLPVYRRWKTGHTREIILVKKVDGNRARLVKDLIGGLGVAGDRIRINPTTQHIELQGDYFEKAKDWLLQKGF